MKKIILTLIGVLIVMNTSWAVSDSEPLTKEDFENAKNSETEKIPEGSDPISNGKKFEGDIDLDGHGIDYYQDSFPIGDGCPMPPDPHVLCNAVKDRSFRWPDAKVPYAISGVFNSYERSRIAKAIQRYKDTTCVQFVPYSGESHYIFFVKEGGCWSYVGRRGGQQKISLDDGCVYTGIIQHEMMHALGFFHEQSRADRDQHIRIRWENIRSGSENNFQSYNLDRIDHLNIQYDYASVMHYRANSFSKNGKNTIEVLESRATIGQRDRLSKHDIVKIKKVYCYSGGGSSSVGEGRGALKPPCTDQYNVCPKYKAWCWAVKQYCCQTCSLLAKRESKFLWLKREKRKLPTKAPWLH